TPSTPTSEGPDGGNECGAAFGSIHPGGMSAVFCDGSVHTIHYTIDAVTWQRLCSGLDGQPVEQHGWEWTEDGQITWGCGPRTTREGLKKRGPDTTPTNSLDRPLVPSAQGGNGWGGSGKSVNIQWQRLCSGTDGSRWTCRSGDVSSRADAGASPVWR